MNSKCLRCGTIKNNRGSCACRPGEVKYINPPQATFKTIVKIKEGEYVPGKARYLYSRELPDHENSHQESQLRTFYTEYTTVTPDVTYHYYEVETTK